MRYVDAHCHLDQYPDPKAEAGACDASQTYTIAVTNLPSAFASMERLAAGRSFVRAAVGLHPVLVGQNANAVDQMLTFIERTKYVGEVGLDYTQADDADRKLQRSVLERIVERCESLGGRVITVHSRRAADDVLAIVGPARRSAVILHWFSGSLKAASRGVSAGCFFSVNPAMIRSLSGQAIIAAIPDDRLLTETDGPFVKHAGHPVRPLDVARTLPALARERGTAEAVLGPMILQNFRRALSIPSATAQDPGC